MDIKTQYAYRLYQEMIPFSGKNAIRYIENIHSSDYCKAAQMPSKKLHQKNRELSL
jgi:hypothetical protein